MSDIETRVTYNPKLTFDKWAKKLIDLPSESDVSYTEVIAQGTLKSRVLSMSWKVNPAHKLMEELVMAAVKAYGGILEGKHFYFKRDITDRQAYTDYKVTLYVIEG